MTKGDIIDVVAQEADITKKAATDAVDAVLGSIAKALKKKEKVTLIGFGTFSVTKRKARSGVNPATGEKIKIKAKNVVKFKPGTKLSESV